jgi:hypothetical protein
LIYKYIGGLAFMFLNTTLVVGGIWLILGLRSGVWAPGFLASIPVLTFQFALYYSISTIVGVTTRSSIAAILVTCFAWFLFAFVIGTGYRVIEEFRKFDDIAAAAREQGQQMPRAPTLPEWVYTSADIIHFVTPRLKDLDALSTKLIVDGTLPESSLQRVVAAKLFESFSWTEALSVTSIYIVVLMGLSCWWFATKDY